MKLSYSIENLRRIHKTPPIEIRPITILVGRNSAGKSTFLRSLPLIRQSIETKSSAPILWYGDYVDFGDFETAVTGGTGDDEATFEFSVDELNGRFRGRSKNAFAAYRRVVWHDIRARDVVVKFVIGSRSGKTELKKIKINILSEDIDLELRLNSNEDSSIFVNGENIPFSSNYSMMMSKSDLFGSPFFLWKSRDSDKPVRVDYPDDVLARLLNALLSRNVPRNIGNRTITREVGDIISSSFTEEDLLELERFSSTLAFQGIYKRLRLGRKGPLESQIFLLQKAARALRVLEVINETLADFFHGVSYLGPARAAGERFYRKQELEVSEIAPNGANFPMFLASLSSRRLLRFSKWIEGIFGFQVELFPSEGHISIKLKAGSRSINITDTGYGMSQVLPVLGVIWWAMDRPKLAAGLSAGRAIQTLAIEQPELHLHPAHQALLGDAFVGAILADSERSLTFVIETHSEALVNRLGELIEDGVISHDDVQIVVFSAEDDIDSATQVSLAKFDKTGALNNWPFGFFNYSSK